MFRNSEGPGASREEKSPVPHPITADSIRLDELKNTLKEAIADKRFKPKDMERLINDLNKEIAELSVRVEQSSPLNKPPQLPNEEVRYGKDSLAIGDEKGFHRGGKLN